LSNIRELEGPQFLHIVTQKGTGYAMPRKDCTLYHGVSKSIGQRYQRSRS